MDLAPQRADRPDKKQHGTRVTLRPGDKRTKPLVAEFVNHRSTRAHHWYDASGRIRRKADHLVVEQARWEPGDHAADLAGRPGPPPVLVGVRVAYENRALQRQTRQAGGRWVRELRL